MTTKTDTYTAAPPAWHTVPAYEQNRRDQAVRDDLPVHLADDGYGLQESDRDAAEAVAAEIHAADPDANNITFVLRTLNARHPEAGRIVTLVIKTANGSKLDVWMELLRKVRDEQEDEIWIARQAVGTTWYW